MQKTTKGELDECAYLKMESLSPMDFLQTWAAGVHVEQFNRVFL